MNAQSPYSLSLRNEIIFGGAIVGSNAFGLLTSSSMEPLTKVQIENLNKNDINCFDRSATENSSVTAARVSDVGVYTCMLAPIVLLSSQGIRNDWMTVGVMYAETIGLAVGLPSLTKNTFQRVRPYVYNPEVELEKKMELDAQRSFFSSHTAVAFSSAVFISSVYSSYYPKSKIKPLIIAGSLVAASTVGYMRYASGNHYPTDILLGAAVGAGVGYIVPLLHKNKGSQDLVIVPSVGPNTIGFNLSYKL